MEQEEKIEKAKEIAKMLTELLGSIADDDLITMGYVASIMKNPNSVLKSKLELAMKLY